MDLVTQQRLTKAFISVKPDTIVFTPRTRERQPSGGFKMVEGTPRDPETVTFIESTGLSGTPRPTATLDGVVREAEMTIVGEHDATFDVRDVFTHQGRDWEIIGVFYDNGYERRALVSSRG